MNVQSIEIAAPPQDLFHLTQDYNRRLDWDPFLRSARLVDGATSAGLGVRALCAARSGMTMETEYISFKPPRVAAVKMTRGPLPLARFAGAWRFHERLAGQSTVSFHYDLTARPRWLSWLLTPILSWLFARATRRRLVALKAAVEEDGLLMRHADDNAT